MPNSLKHYCPYCGQDGDPLGKDHAGQYMCSKCTDPKTKKRRPGWEHTEDKSTHIS